MKLYLSRVFKFEFILCVVSGSGEHIVNEKSGVRSVRISGDGKVLASGDRQGNIRYDFFLITNANVALIWIGIMVECMSLKHLRELISWRLMRRRYWQLISLFEEQVRVFGSNSLHKQFADMILKIEPVDNLNLMATGSRDRLIHIFDVKNDFRLIQTLEDHTSSITALQFCDHGRKLMSSAADKSIIFRSLQEVIRLFFFDFLGL
jgi:WD40 repeat protein